MIKSIFANNLNIFLFVLQLYFFAIVHLHAFHQINSPVV